MTTTKPRRQSGTAASEPHTHTHTHTRAVRRTVPVTSPDLTAWGARAVMRCTAIALSVRSLLHGGDQEDGQHVAAETQQTNKL